MAVGVEVAMSVEGPSPASTLTLRKPYLGKRRDSEDSTLRMSLTAAGPNGDASHLPSSPTMSGKRKQPELNAAGKFKAVSQLVVAMNRFKASLNPTYTFGKRQESGSSGQAAGWVRESADGSAEEVSPLSALHRSPATPEVAQQRQQVYSTHGHKTNYLLRSLPPAKEEHNSLSGELSDDL